jgi:hypothetical protein
VGYVDLSTLHSPIGGQRPPAEWGRAVDANFDFLAKPPGCRVRNTGAQTIATSGTPQALAFDVEDWDWSTPMHDTLTNNDRLTCVAAGKHIAVANVSWEANATGRRDLYIEKFNSAGTTQGIYGYDRKANAGASDPTIQEAVAEIDLAAGDFVRAYALQTSGGDLDVLAAGKYSPAFSLRWTGQ